MTASNVDSILALHTCFWNRTLDAPIINIDCSSAERSKSVPALPGEWEDQDGLVLEPEMLSPEVFQQEPALCNSAHPLWGDVAFNVLPPYFRLPWLGGIMGCDLTVSAIARTVWPSPYLPDNWYELENQGFAPRLEWLDKLMEFVRFVVANYYPDRCMPTLDQIARGPGDLIHNVLGPERLYFSFYDHPDEVMSLLEQMTDLYIRWVQTQLEVIPRVWGGYCNQYGIWSPGTCLRTQEDYALNLSRDTFHEFFMPNCRRVVESFEYQVFHTHSAFPQLAEWVMEIDELKCIEVALDPQGPTIEQSIALWSRILEEKSLLIIGPVTPTQLDLVVSSLEPGGLWLDIELVTEAELDTAWEYEKTGR